MAEQIVALVLDESKWLSTSMLLSIIAALVLAVRQRGQSLSPRFKIIGAMNLFYGYMIGLMSFGHLLAVTVKVFQGTLEGSLWILYPLGLALVIPAWWLVFDAGRIASFEQRWQGKLVALNAWLGLCLLALGFHNLPLAGPAALNIAYQFHTRPIVGWTIVSAAIVAMLALFIASLVFLASGQSFEQFRGM
jgi:hypothetical protein